MLSDLTNHVPAISLSPGSSIVHHRKTNNLKYLKSIDGHKIINNTYKCTMSRAQVLCVIKVRQLYQLNLLWKREV